MRLVVQGPEHVLALVEGGEVEEQQPFLLAEEALQLVVE
jgi:hypothetical protein